MTSSLTCLLGTRLLPDQADLHTGEIISNGIGVSGATREREAKFVDSDPKDAELLVRAVGG